MSAAQKSAIPAFYLYGEPQRNVARGFVHVENLDDRSRPSEWTIRSHRHQDLHHIILIADGGGAMQADSASVEFASPALLLVPAGIVHGFQWHSESRGWVVTLADSYFAELATRDGDIAALFQRASVLNLSTPDSGEIERIIHALNRELGWTGPGHNSAVMAAILSLMVLALRNAHLDKYKNEALGRQMEIVARLRERIEERFRQREPVHSHAKAIGVSQTALRLACAQVAGLSPAAMLDARTLLEARRLLLYTQLSVNEIAWAIGFDDPAYFSRFFTRHTGRSPRDYRASASK